LEADRLYGVSDRAQLIFTISCAFFLWDFYYLVFLDDKLDFTMFIHHIVFFSCFILVQAPFIQYYAIRILLFEVSTIFLNPRQMLKMLGKSGILFKCLEICFGISFLLVRNIYGIWFSVDAILYMNDNMNKISASKNVVRFIIAANVFANGLNLYWMAVIVRMVTSSKKETKKVSG